jgi:thiamine-phosphate pyrophosphorylase
MKDCSLDEYIVTAKRAREMTSEYNGILIINDNVEVAIVSHADGLHLGLNDLSVSEARKILGEKKIIGGTANTLEDVIQRIEEGADYIGLGPYHFTTTKKNLSPVLGLDGYKIILDQPNIVGVKPIYAIGGIEVDDIKPLLEIGVYGMAASGMMTNTQSLQKLIYFMKEEEIVC